MKARVFLLLMVVLVAGLGALYSTRSESKKRFIKNMVRQVPYLPGRYFA